jgi:hypothetical protein
MKKTTQLEPQVSSRLDLTLTKDDVITVLLVEEEKKLQAEVDLLDKKLEEIQEFLSIENFKEVVLSDLKVKGKAEVNIKDIFHNSYGSHKSKIRVELVNVSHLSTLSRVNSLTIRNHTISKTEALTTPKSKHTVNVEKEITTPDGFVGSVYKEVEYKPTAKFLAACKQYDAKVKEKVSLMLKKNELELKILTLDSNKEVKANLIKKIVSQTDYKQFLLNM